MFMDHTTISNYAKMAFPEQAMEVVDPQLLEYDNTLSKDEDVLLSSLEIASNARHIFQTIE